MRLLLSLRFFCCWLLVLFLGLMFFSCKRAIVDNSLQRTEESMRKFAGVLSSSSEGWNVCIVASDERRWHFWMRFYEDGRVEMRGDISKESGVVKTSQYAVRELQQPTLTFATYNHISRLADPDPGFGKTQLVDIQYAFSEDLVRYLSESKDNSIQSFALQGRLHQAKAYFSRIGKYGIVADTSLAIKLKLDSIRWKDSASVNVLTKNEAISSGDNGGSTNAAYTLDNVFLYDLHTGTGVGSVYDQVIGITSFNRKGSALVYYVDCEGHLRFRVAGEDVKVRRSFVDANFTKQWTSGYYNNFHWSKSNDTTRLLFFHHRGGTIERLAFESKSLSNLSSVTSSLQGKAAEDTALFGGKTSNNFVAYTFRGFTARNIRDAWDLRQGGRVNLFWVNRYLPSGEPYSLIYFFPRPSQLRGPIVALSFAEHPNNIAYNYKFVNSRNPKQLLRSFSGDDREGRLLSLLNNLRQSYLRDVSALHIFCRVFSSRSSIHNTNLYTLLPVVLGFQLHRRGGAGICDNSKQSGVLIPVYFEESVN